MPKYALAPLRVPCRHVARGWPTRRSSSGDRPALRPGGPRAPSAMFQLPARGANSSCHVQEYWHAAGRCLHAPSPWPPASRCGAAIP
eukprot:3140705-Alexandrium_andersonii.AAC.1